MLRVNVVAGGGLTGWVLELEEIGEDVGSLGATLVVVESDNFRVDVALIPGQIVRYSSRCRSMSQTPLIRVEATFPTN